MQAIALVLLSGALTASRVPEGAVELAVDAAEVTDAVRPTTDAFDDSTVYPGLRVRLHVQGEGSPVVGALARIDSENVTLRLDGSAGATFVAGRGSIDRLEIGRSRGGEQVVLGTAFSVGAGALIAQDSAGALWGALVGFPAAAAGGQALHRGGGPSDAMLASTATGAATAALGGVMLCLMIGADPSENVGEIGRIAAFGAAVGLAAGAGVTVVGRERWERPGRDRRVLRIGVAPSLRRGVRAAAALSF